MFIGSRSSFTSDLLNKSNKSSISEEMFGKYNLGFSKKEFVDLRNSFLSNCEKSCNNEFSLFKKITNVFTEPIREITLEENTNKTNKTSQTIEYDENPICCLMEELKAESKPKKPSKDF